MQIDWWTVLLQSANFLVLLWLLWRFLYRPAKDVISKRKALADNVLAEAEKLEREASDAKAHLEEERAKWDEEHRELLKQGRAQLEQERKGALDQTRVEAEKLIADARETIADERAAAAREVREEVVDLAIELATRVLRMARSGESSEATLERLGRHLGDLPALERERLADELGRDGASLTIVTAQPLPPDRQQQWRERLRVFLNERLGERPGEAPSKTVEVTFETEPDLLGGAELRFPNTVVRCTWVDRLAQARAHLLNDEDAG